MRVLIIGGGYLGSKVRAALASAASISVTTSTRRKGGTAPCLDVTDPSTFGAMSGFDVVVNCSDAVKAPPLAAAEHCLREGRIFIETSAHPRTLEQFLLWRKRLSAEGGPAPTGLVIVGMGIFPGVSNLLARQLARRLGKVERLEMAVRLNALSGGGAGMVAQMLDSLFEPAIRYEQGQRIQELPIRPGIEFPFQEGLRSSVRVGLPESIMMNWSIGVPNTATYLSLRPGFTLLGIRVLSWLGCNLGKVVRAGVIAFTRLSLLTIRRILFRNRPTPVQIGVIANRQGSVKPEGETLLLSCPDGVRAAGEAIAAACLYLQATKTPQRGVVLPDELFGDDFLPLLGKTSIALPPPATSAA